MNNGMIEMPLKKLVEDRGRSLYWLSKETGLAYTTIWKLASGDSQGISFDVLEKICEKLECTPNDLLPITPSKKKNGSKK